MKHTITLVAVTLLAVSTFSAPAMAAGLLGLIGSGDSGSLVTIDSGSAGTSGLVNVGLGGSDGNVVDANIGSGSNPLGTATITSGGDNGLLNVNANIGDGLATTSVGVGGSGGSLVNATVDVGNGVGVGVDVALGLPGLPGLPGGNNGANGNNGTNGTNGANGLNGVNTSNGVTTFYSISGSAGGRQGGGGGGFALNYPSACRGALPGQLMGLFGASDIKGWDRASTIQLVPLKVCPAVRKDMARALAIDPDYRHLVSAVARDPLVSETLRRTRYQPGHVLAVQRSGDMLRVYVF